jgi:hypothetical protein
MARRRAQDRGLGQAKEHKQNQTESPSDHDRPPNHKENLIGSTSVLRPNDNENYFHFHQKEIKHRFH